MKEPTKVGFSLSVNVDFYSSQEKESFFKNPCDCNYLRMLKRGKEAKGREVAWGQR